MVSVCLTVEYACGRVQRAGELSELYMPNAARALPEHRDVPGWLVVLIASSH